MSDFRNVVVTIKENPSASVKTKNISINQLLINSIIISEIQSFSYIWSKFNNLLI